MRRIDPLGETLSARGMNRTDPSPGAALSRLTSGQRHRATRAAALATLADAIWAAQAAAVAVTLAVLAGADGGPGSGTILWLCASGFVAGGILRAGLGALAGRMLVRAGDSLTRHLRHEVLRRADRRGPLNGAAHSAAIAALATDKLALLLPYLRRWPVARMRVAVIPALFILLALPISWAAAMIFAVTGPLIPVFMALIGMAAGQASQDRMDEITDMNSLLVERLSALTDIRLLDANAPMLSGFTTMAHRLRSRTMRVLALAFLSSTVLELFSAVGVAIMAVFVGLSLLDLVNFGTWGAELTMAQGVFLLMLAPAFYQPMRDLAAAWHDRADALALARDLEAEAARPAPPIMGEGAAAAALPFLGLRTEGLRIDGQAIPDFEILPGGSLALTGASGSGKSRLIAVLAGLTEPTEGKVMLSGRALVDGNADAWRASIAIIPQQVHFSHETLAANLAGGLVVDQTALAEALKLAHAEGVVDGLPEGLRTHLGERGAGVSGGEARRLMIARAALRRPALLLADEPTADLDDDTAQQVIDGLLSMQQQGAALIVASHDQRLIAAMSRQVAI